MISARPYGEELWGAADTRKDTVQSTKRWRQQAGPGAKKLTHKAGFELNLICFFMQPLCITNFAALKPETPGRGRQTAETARGGGARQNMGKTQSQIAKRRNAEPKHAQKAGIHHNAIAKAQQPHNTTESSPWGHNTSRWCISVRITAGVAADATTAELERAGSATMIFLLPSHYCYC